MAGPVIFAALVVLFVPWMVLYEKPRVEREWARRDMDRMLRNLGPLVVKLAANIVSVGAAMQAAAASFRLFGHAMRAAADFEESERRFARTDPPPGYFHCRIDRDGTVTQYQQDDMIDSWRYVWEHHPLDGVIDVESRERDQFRRGMVIGEKTAPMRPLRELGPGCDS